MTPEAQLQLVSDTLDAIGVEPGDLPQRLAFLRGAACGFNRAARASAKAARAVEKARQAEEDEARRALHHPSWSESRTAFHAALRDLGVKDKYAVVAAFCESRNLPRPSAMAPEQREKFLGSLQIPEKRFKFDEWAAQHGDGQGNELAGVAK